MGFLLKREMAWVSVEAQNGVGLPVGNVVVADVVVDSVAWACRSQPGGVGLSLEVMEPCQSRPGGVGLGLEVVEPCRI